MSKIGISGIVSLLILLAAAMPSLAAIQELTYDSFNTPVNISYDNLNRILAKNFSTGSHNYTYDADYYGTLTNVTFANGSFAYEYDDKLRIVKEIRFIDGVKFEKTIDYDSADRAVRIFENPGIEAGYIYGSQGLIERVAGYVNATRHSAFGSVLNRTYSSGKATNFTYDGINARLARINTDSLQNLLFTYDAVGNILMINDTANGREQIMTYDHLDRLLNMSLNGGQSFVYRYDAIGNLFNILKDGAVTALTYGEAPIHAPKKVATGNAGANSYGFTALNSTDKTRIVEFRLLNDRNATVNVANWTVGFSDNAASNSTLPINLTSGEKIFVIVGHEFATGGSYAANVTSGSLPTPSGFGEGKMKFGIRVDAIEVVSRNITNITFRFAIKNDFANNVSGVSWQCNNGLSASGITVNGLSNKTIEESYNYTTSGIRTLNCSVASSEGNDSITTNFEIEGIKIEAYNLTFSDGNTTNVRFNITNLFHPRPVNWRVISDGQTFTGTTPAIATNSSVVVSQEVNYTTPGIKTVEINITADRVVSESFSDSFAFKALEIEDYYLRNISPTMKNFEFRVRNRWTSNLSSSWNITDPSIANTSFFLDSGEFLWVYAEADYAAQGVKKPKINAFNGSLGKSILERFANRLIEILNYRTVAEYGASSVTEAYLRSNKDAYNISWTFRAGENSAITNVTEVNSTADFVVIIESGLPAFDVNNASFFINSSSINESTGGVIIS